MVWLVLGLVLFLGVHSIAIISPDGRNRLAAQLGENAFRACIRWPRSRGWRSSSGATA